MTTAAPRVARRRARRDIDVSTPGKASTPPPTKEMLDAARQAYLANLDKNAASREEKAQLKKLHGLMAKGKVPKFDMQIDLGDAGKDIIDAQIEETSSDKVDINELYGKVSLETFLKIVGASAAAVEREAGANVKAMVVTTTKGDDKVTVKKRKA